MNLRRLKQSVDLIRVLVGRDIKLLYKRSALGVLWTLVNPLLQLLTFVFLRAVLKFDIPHFTSYVFTGLLVWQWFSKTTSQSTSIIIGNRPLIRQPGFPVAVLPPVVVTTGMIHFALALPVLMVFLFFDGLPMTPALMWLPVVMLIQFFLTVTLAYLLAGINVVFRDTQNAWAVLVQAFFFLTPIFYSLRQIPEHFHALYVLNPMVSILTAYRSILIEGHAPDWTALFKVVAVLAVLFPMSVLLFRHQSRRFVEEI
ncbi:ABC transporter permease [Thiocapsa marina]|uniref:Transport permease protein n=1 Tax=Thiocapsa marina 5811 TaxID=768671 RepID=F9UAT4_9GAMM|nr:ABC transporter permease [Thiocapsa marina]EGV18552.1 ABC-2 type transporter [Thiocapsa marina 5811]